MKQDKIGLWQGSSTSWFPGRKAYGSEVAFPLRCSRRPMVSLQEHMGFHYLATHLRSSDPCPVYLPHGSDVAFPLRCSRCPMRANTII